MRAARIVILAIGLLVPVVLPDGAAAACPGGLPDRTNCTIVRVPLDRLRGGWAEGRSLDARRSAGPAASSAG
jgi:hypothetical protein